MHRTKLSVDVDVVPRNFTVENAESYIEIALRAHFASEEFFEDTYHLSLGHLRLVE